MKKYIIAVCFLIVAAALLLVKSDRLVLQLIPTPGMTNAVVMNSHDTYQQDIVMHSSTIARVGFFFTPTVASLPADNLTLTLYRGTNPIASSTVSSVFIDADGSTIWQFAKPVNVTPGETIHFQVTIPDSLSEKIRLKLRQPDNTFNVDSAHFFLNKQSQSAPLGYELYSFYKPPLAMQLAGLLLAAAIFMVIPKHKPILTDIAEVICAFWFTLLYLIPLINHGSFTWFLWVIQSIAFYSMYRYLRTQNLHPAAALGGSALFAFTSWFPLQYTAHRFLLCLIVMLPLALTFFAATTTKLQKVILGLLTAVALIAISVSGLNLPIAHVSAAANIKDIFLDPYQAPQAQKVLSESAQSISWDNFGSYIGLAGLTLALIGAVANLKKHWRAVLLLIIVLIILSNNPLAQFISSLNIPIALGHLSIVATFLLAYLAAVGVENLYKFFGYHHRLTAILLNTVVIIVLVDMWHIAADLLESLP